MAGVVLEPAEKLLSKRVQEMVINGEQPPHLYICRNDSDEAEADQGDPSHKLSSIPIINIGVLSSSESTPAQVDELQRLHSALSSWGCFQVI